MGYNRDMSECLFTDEKIDPALLHDFGEGWTGYIREAEQLRMPLTELDMGNPCLIAAFLEKVRGWHAGGSARMGRDDRLCKRCGRYLNITIFSPDVDKR